MYWGCFKYISEKTKQFLPVPVSMMLDCPLRSATSRDEPGMLTGSERTGWILHTFSKCTLLDTYGDIYWPRMPVWLDLDPHGGMWAVVYCCTTRHDKFLGNKRFRCLIIPLIKDKIRFLQFCFFTMVVWAVLTHQVGASFGWMQFNGPLGAQNRTEWFSSVAISEPIGYCLTMFSLFWGLEIV